MVTTQLRLPGILLLLLLPCFSVGAQTVGTSCIDSIRVALTPVSCNSYRDGLIKVDTVFGGKPPYYYSIDDLSFSTRNEFDRLFPDTYTIIVRDDSGCIFEQTVVIEEPEILEVSLTADVTSVYAGIPFNLKAFVEPPDAHLTAISWRPPALFSQMNTLEQTGIRISQTTTFAIEVVNDKGCTARAQATVVVDDTQMYFPNIIKIGSNLDARFTVFAGDGVVSIKMLRIYSREGALMFERSDFPPNDPQQGWNARHNNRPVQPGVFAWVADIELADGAIVRHTGSLTVVK